MMAIELIAHGESLVKPSIDQAAKKARQLARTYESVLMVAEVLDNISSLDTETQRATEAAKQAQSNEKLADEKKLEAEDRLVKLVDKIRCYDKEAECIVEQGHIKANTLVAEAKGRAKTIEATATMAASESRGEAERYRVKHNKFVVEQKAKEKDLADRINLLKAELAKIKEKLGL